MTQTFSNWKSAHKRAVELARILKRETGIEKSNEFGHTVFNIRSLPNIENRCGHELRMEVVRPGDPL